MDSPVTPRSATIGGAVLLVLALGLTGVLLFTTPFTGCTDVGVPEDTNTGYEFVGIENGNIVYSPDGVNKCQSPLQVVLIPLVPGVVGLLLLGYGRFSNDQQAAGVDAPDTP